MGVLVPVRKVGEAIEVEIPNEILPDEYTRERTEVKYVTETVPTVPFIYAGRGPTRREGIFEAIEAARRVRYRLGVMFSVRDVMRRGFPSDLRLVRICYPPVPGIRREEVCVDVKERPRITLRPRMVRGRIMDWRGAIPVDITRRYGLYAFSRYHPLVIYNPVLYLEWTSLRTVRIPPKEPDVYHVGEYYKPEWRLGRWVWKLTKGPCYDAADVGLSIGAAPAAQCFFEDGVVYIDIMFSPYAGKQVARRLGYAYVNSYVRNYTLSEETKREVDYPLLIEVRATYISACPIEFRQYDTKHMKLCSLDETNALGITVYNVLRNFLVGSRGVPTVLAAERKGTVQYTLEGVSLRDYYLGLEEPYGTIKTRDFPFGTALREDNELIETTGVMINRKYDFSEVQDFPFYRCYKYVRIINEQTYKRHLDRWMYEYLNDEIESKLKLQEDKIVDRDGFVWRRRL